MLITIDTNNITDGDRAILAQVLNGVNARAAEQAAVLQDHRERVDENIRARVDEKLPADKPKRSRRTNPEIAFDEAKTAYDADQGNDTYAPLFAAAEALKAKDPDNERLIGFYPEAEPDDSGAAFSPDDTADTDGTPGAEADGVTVEDVKELATKLIVADRAAMVSLLEQYVPDGEPKRVSNVPESRLSEFADQIRKALD